MKVVIGCDHAGWTLKSTIMEHVRSLGHEVIEVGAYDDQPVDFPDIASELAQRISSKEAERGIMVCGTGVGAAIAANKIRGIRAATCHDSHSAHQAVEHDDVNVMCIGAKIVGPWLAEDLVSAYLAATFSTDPNCRRRVRKLCAMEASPSVSSLQPGHSAERSGDLRS